METNPNPQASSTEPEVIVAPIEEEIVLPSDVVPDELEGLSKEELIAKLKEANAPKDEVVDDVVVPASIVEEFTAKFNANEGVFTEQDYADLEAKGYSKEFVDTYIEGAKAKELKHYTDLIAPYGTLEDYASAMVYAQNNWTEAQVSQYNNALSKADDDTTVILVASLMKEFKSSGTPPPVPNAPITNTTQPPVQSVKGYETKSDMVKDMADSRYGKDPAYTRKVEEKMGSTDMNSWYANVRRGD